MTPRTLLSVARCLLAVACYLLPVALLSAHQSIRDARGPAATGTSSISGTLLSDERTPQEIRRARVDVTADGLPPRNVYTDERGRFSFVGLPAGRYTLVAAKPGYVRAAYGAKRSDRPGTPITLAEGQQLGNIALKMPKGGVITGTIRDELGQPAPGATVRVLQYRMQNGERVLQPAALASGPLGETTDDRGTYRLFGLAAGEYYVSASPRSIGSSDIKQMTTAEIQSVMQSLQQRTASAAGVQTQAARPAPLTVTYATMYFPGTTSAAAAQPVIVTAGEERAGVDFALQLVRTSRVEGVVVTPNGVPPQSAQLLVLPAGGLQAGLPSMISLNRVTPDTEGKFSFSGLAPGQYTISARIGGSSGGGGRGGGGFADVMMSTDGRGANASQQSTLWAQADVTIDGENVSGLTLTMQPGLTISGRVTVEANGVDAPDDYSKTRLSLLPGGAGGPIMVTMTSSGAGTQVDRGGRFTIGEVIPGKYRLSAQLSTPEANWTLKSAVINGRDSLDFPVEIGPNDRAIDAHVTFTNQTQDVSGTLQNAAGRPAPDFTIVVFPSDKALWLATRRIRTVRPDTEGKFILKGMPAGSYRIAALTDIAQGEANDPTFLEQLVSASIPFTLAPGESKVQDIKMAGGG